MVLWRKFFFNKLLIFLYWCVNKYCWFEFLIFPCRLQRELFSEMLHGDHQSTFFNSTVILWQIWRFFLMLWKNKPNFSLNLLYCLWYIQMYIIDTQFLIYFLKKNWQLLSFCLNSAKGCWSKKYYSMINF